MPLQPPSLCRRRERKNQDTILLASVSESQSSTKTVAASPDSSNLSPNEVFRLSLLSGAVAGFSVDAALFPLDTLKTRMQIAVPAGAPPRTTASLFTGLYAGFGPAVIASAPAAAAFFGVYDYVKRVLANFDRDGRWAPVCHLIAAGAGDVAGSTVRAPFEVVKQRMQSGIHATASAAIKATLTQEGPLGFFRGYGSLVLRDLPFDAIQFPLYEYLKLVSARRHPERPLQTWETSLCGCVAGAVSAALTTPVDVVKTRLMTQNPAAPKYHGIIHGLTTIAKEEGPKALSAGIVPRVMWISIGGAIFFGAYEGAKKALLPFVVPDKAQLNSEKMA